MTCAPCCRPPHAQGILFSLNLPLQLMCFALAWPELHLTWGTILTASLGVRVIGMHQCVRLCLGLLAIIYLTCSH